MKTTCKEPELATRKLFLMMLVFACYAVHSMAQDAGTSETSERRVALEVDRRAKHLFDKAIELMEYKQYERGLTMLDTVIRDNEGNILGYQAHMARGRHFLEQRKSKEALSHFLLLSRLLAPLPGETPSPLETELYREALFQAGFSYYQ